jgi:putative phosphoribosyl transferase
MTVWQSEAQSQAVRIGAGEVLLNGDLRLPPRPQGLVLFAHGSGSSRKSPRNRFVADVLVAAGLGTLLFDLLTEEEERIDLRTRELRFDIPLLTGRLAGAAVWVRSEKSLRGLPLGFFGASTGAAAALAASCACPEVVAVVSRGGRPDLAGERLAEVTAATLLIVGGEDRQVIELNREALAQMRCEARLEIVPGATHLFEEPGTLARAAGLAAAWFAAHFRASETETRRSA